MSKRAGATVIAQYSAQEVEQHIQTFFFMRQNAVIDLCRSMEPLFSRAQWLALKSATPKQLDEMERLCVQGDVLPPYMMTRHLQLIYGTLHNDLLLRLVWHALMFFQAPFLSLPSNIEAFKDGDSYLLQMIGLCRQRNWKGLWDTVKDFQIQLTNAINQFYKDRITPTPAGQTVAFHWSPYQKSSQLCYSLAIELLRDISRGIYSENDFLPSPAIIAKDKQVSVSTVRRTLALLNQLGATRSINGVGTQVLSGDYSAEHCDFSQPILQKRLLDFAQSLQILSLTCKASAELTFGTINTAFIDRWKEELMAIKQTSHHEAVVYTSLEVISHFTPVQAVREVYGQLLKTLIWGYPLRSIHGSRKEINEFYLPYIDSLIEYLDCKDGTGLALQLESLLYFEFKFAVERLCDLGISGASDLVTEYRAV